MPLVAILDACVLHSARLRDLLIRLDLTGMVRARWSERIMEECFASILSRRSDLAPDALDRTRELMKAAIPDWEITGFEDLIEDLELPDPGDRHVRAAERRGTRWRRSARSRRRARGPAGDATRVPTGPVSSTIVMRR